MDLGDDMEEMDPDINILDPDDDLGEVDVDLDPELDNFANPPPIEHGLGGAVTPLEFMSSVLLDSSSSGELLPPLSFYGKVSAATLSDLDVSAIYNHWTEKFHSEELTHTQMFHMLNQYFIRVVPHVYKLEPGQDCLAPFRDVEEAVDKYLIQPLVSFLMEKETFPSSEVLMDVRP